MDCARFDKRLDALLDGTCSDTEWREAEGHAAGCARCRLLLDGLAGGGGEQDASEAEALAATVISRTSGSTCRPARDRLCALADGELPEFDQELLGGHLSRCSACTELLEALALTSSVLPTFADLRPPVALLPAVLAATSRRPPVLSLADRVAGWFERCAARPRFSLEAAYICTLLVFLAVGNPVAAFRETSARGRQLAQPRVEQLIDRVTSGPVGLVGEARAAIAERARAVSARPADADIEAKVSALLASAWHWVESEVVNPVRGPMERVVAWLSAIVRPNP